MKILITTDAFPPEAGGSGQSTAVLTRALSRRGHDVTVVVSKPWERRKEEERDWEGTKVIEVGVGTATLGSAFRREAHLTSFLEQWDERFDLAHAQHWLSAGATIRASRKTGLPVVVTVRDYWPVCIWSTMLSGEDRCPGCSYSRRVVCVGRRYPVLWPVAPLLPPKVGGEIARRQETLRKAAAVVAVSDHVENTLPLTNVSVIPNLIDLESMERSLAKSSPMLPEEFVLFVGKLEPNKAPERALSIMHESGVKLPLLIAGSGRLERSLREKAKRLGVDARMLGWVSEDMVLLLMRRATAVLFPSRWEEPLSRVLLEGLGVGAVLIVEPTGGSGEIVVDQESGLLGRTGSEMAVALNRVFDDPALASRLREGAAQTGRDRFSEDVVLPRLEELYRRVVDER